MKTSKLLISARLELAIIDVQIATEL